MEAAVEFETDWTLVSVLIVGAIIVASLVWSGVAARIWVVAESTSVRRPGAVNVIAAAVWVVVTLAACMALLIVPGAIMRHLEFHSMTWWVFLGSLIAVGVVAVWAYLRDAHPLEFWIPAGMIGAGFLLGWALDSVTRAAASIPISVGAFVLLVIVAVVVVLRKP